MTNPEPYIEEAARFFDMELSTLEPLIGNSGAVVLKGGSPSGPKVLKIDTPSRSDPEEIRKGSVEGFEYQERLADVMTDDIRMVCPIRSPSGDLFAEVATDGGTRLATAYEVAPGREINHKTLGFQVAIEDPNVGLPLYAQIGKAAGIMHRFSSTYRLWWPSADADEPESSFYGKEKSAGGGAARGFRGIIEMLDIEKTLPAELMSHVDSILSLYSNMTAERQDYGILHYDFSNSNLFHDGNILSIIDHASMYGQFVFDIGSAFQGLENAGVVKRQSEDYWHAFADGYCREFTLKDEWLPWIGVGLDLRRILFYALNTRWMNAGRDTLDTDYMDTWYQDMLAGRPFIDIDFEA